MNAIYLRGMSGIGDSINQRPVVRAALSRYDRVYLSTPWPQLYADLPVLCSPSGHQRRTQARNLDREWDWAYPPPGTPEYRLAYGPVGDRSMISQFEDRVGLRADPFVLDLPVFPPDPWRTSRKLAVIRPATLRSEFFVPARNPHVALVARATALLRRRGFYTVLVADLLKDEEWIDGLRPNADQFLVHGELALEQICALVAAAAVVVSPVGFAVPMAMAYRTPLIVLGGGRLLWDGPAAVQDARVSTPVRWILPDRPCYCADARHACSKSVTHFDRQFTTALREVVGR